MTGKISEDPDRTVTGGEKLAAQFATGNFGILVTSLLTYIASAATTLTNKTISAASNTISGLTTGTFAAGVVDTDITLAANSDTRIPTQKAVKAYASSVGGGGGGAPPGTITPLMDGTAAVGTTTNYAREDHRHPSDTVKLDTSHAGTGGASHADVIGGGASGFMIGSDKTKLDGIATGANNYVHPSGDGNLHVPATGTTNNTKVLTAGPTAGSLSWTVPGAPSGSALTRTDDTNVTLTLGGTPATALLQATSITVGWSGTLSAARGGTGQATYAVGDILYASGTTALSRLADVATGNALISGGAGVAPAWGKVALTTHVSGTLPIANGGTNATTAALALTSLGAVAKAGDTMSGVLRVDAGTGFTTVGAGTTGGFISGGLTTKTKWTFAFDDAYTITRFDDAGVAVAIAPQVIRRDNGTSTFNAPQLILKANNAPASAFTSALSVGYSGGATQYGAIFRPAADTTTAMTFQSAADAIIGSISQTTTATAYNTSSSGELKEDLQSFDAGHIIDDTNVYDFAWKSTGERAYGVIAQQAVEVYPLAVTHTEECEAGPEFWGVDYAKYVPVILQELKALRARVAELEGKP